MQQCHLEVFTRLRISPETLRRKVNRGQLAQLFSGELRLCQALHRRASSMRISESVAPVFELAPAGANPGDRMPTSQRH
jgi:hypothetical protein